MRAEGRIRAQQHVHIQTRSSQCGGYPSPDWRLSLAAAGATTAEAEVTVVTGSGDGFGGQRRFLFAFAVNSTIHRLFVFVYGRRSQMRCRNGKKEESEKVRDKIGGLVRQQQDAELNISLKRLHAL